MTGSRATWRFVLVATVAGGLTWPVAIAIAGVSLGLGLTEEAGLIGTSALIAVFHWSLVRRLVPSSRWWIDAYWVGWYAGWLWAINLGVFVPDVRALGGVAGGVGGIAQWIALRHRFRYAWLSIIVSPIALVVACWSGVAIGQFINLWGFEEAAVPFGSAFAGSVMGLLVAAQLVWVGRRPVERLSANQRVGIGSRA
jgi:hypothetical protein